MDKASDFAVLALRFRSLGKADRTAVLANLSPDERLFLDHALVHQAKADREEEDRQRRTDLQFHAYSPWLADLVEQAVAGQGGPGRLTAHAARVVAIQHSALIQANSDDPDLGIPNQLRRAWRMLLAVPAENRQ